MAKEIEYSIYEQRIYELKYEELLKLAEHQKEHIKALEGQIDFMYKVIRNSKR